MQTERSSKAQEERSLTTERPAPVASGVGGLRAKRGIPRPGAHWTPRYLWSRLMWSVYQKRNPGLPWLTPRMIEFMDGYVVKSDLVVEFGSGRSTLWWAKRAGRVISIEHHAKWYEEISAIIKQEGIGNIEYRCAEKEAGAYVAAADSALGSGRADVILIDGIHREMCATWALAKIKPGGVIVVDNVNWFLESKTKSPPRFGTHPGSRHPNWIRFGEATSTWRRYWTSNNVADTAAFFAPADWRGGAGE